MKTNNDSFFVEPVDPQQEARAMVLEVVCRLFIWMAEGPTLEERGLRATVALYCVRPDLINQATLEEVGNLSGRSRQAVHQLATASALPRDFHHERRTRFIGRRRNQPAV